MRPVATGIYVERYDGWRVTVQRFGGVSEVYDNSDPGWVHHMQIDLDGMGCTRTISIDTTANPLLRNYDALIRIEVHQLAADWQEIAMGWIDDVVPTGIKSWQIRCFGLIDLATGGYFRGLSDLFTGLSFATHDLLTPVYPAAAKLDTYKSILDKALEPYTDASYGVDANYRLIIGRPSQGTQVVVNADLLLDLRSTGWVKTPIVTEARGASSDGQFSVELSTVRQGFVPRRAQNLNIQGGNVTTKEITSSSGPRVLQAQVITIKEGTSGTGSSSQSINLSGEITRRGAGAVLVAVWDVADWFRLSVLNNPGQQNGYEPVNASVSLGVRLDGFPPPPDPETEPEGGGGGYGGGDNSEYDNAVVFIDSAFWISRIAGIDTAAVGNPLPAVPSPIHPQASNDTINIYHVDSNAKTVKDIGKEFTVRFEFPANMFRQKQDEWLAQFGGYTGPFFLHGAIGWEVIEGTPPP